jgi:AcrR family transcriptional regulator
MGEQFIAMARQSGEKVIFHPDKHKEDPPGKIKIANALKTLLKEKDFNSITSAEIAHTSGVNEALIYRYYNDKRGLLHHILSNYLRQSGSQIDSYLRDISGSLNKLKKIIWHTFETYDKNRIFAKILLVEVRNFPGYFKSETYFLAKQYSLVVLRLLKEGIESGEFRKDISAWHMMQTIIGAIEHLILPSVIFDRKLDIDACTNSLYKILFNGIINKK